MTRKMWLTRVGHVDPFDSDRERWVRTLHRWFDSELMGIDNGILDEPAVDVEVRPEEWVTQLRWPARGRTVLTPRADGRMVDARQARSGNESWTNDPNQSEITALTAGAEARRLLFATDPLRRATRISGTASATLRVTSEVPTGQVGVLLVDYGLGERVLAVGDGVTTTQEESCHGSSVSYDDACYFTARRNIGTTPLQVLGRGWARLDGAGAHDVKVTMDPDDAIVSRGHRLGLVIVAAAPSRLRNVDTSNTSRYTLDLTRSSFSVPGDVVTMSSDAARTLQWLPERDELTRGTVAPPAKGFVLPR